VFCAPLEPKVTEGVFFCRLQTFTPVGTMAKGKRIRLTNGRQLVDDVISIAQRIPSAGIGGVFDLGAIGHLRRLTRPKISWNVLYMKAYALVATKMPQLNQVYVRFPWPHLYQHDSVVCMMTVIRQYQGEDRLFFARFNDPQNCSLNDLQQRYAHFMEAPIEEIRQFRHQIRFAQCPRLLRWLGWRIMFDWWPAKRASHVGTIGMSFSGYRGVYGNRHLGPLTSILGIDPMPRKGIGRLTLTFDHRVLDGIPAALTLESIQQHLQQQIKMELEQMVGKSAEAA